MPKHISAFIADAHTATWCVTKGCGSICATSRCTKPGDPLGDALFNLLMASLLRQLHAKLLSENLIAAFPIDNEAVFTQDPVRRPQHEDINIIGVSHVDDEATFSAGADPLILVRKVRRAAQIVRDTFATVSLEANFAKGKMR